MKKSLSFPLALVVAAALSTSPALAQKGRGHGNGGGNGRGHEAKEQQHIRRNDDRDDRVRRSDRDDDDRWTDRVLRNRTDSYRRSDSYRNSGTLRRRVPPGWCIGRGNPHNTVENCGRGSNRYDRRYDPRYNGGYTYDNYGRRTDRYGRTVDSYGRVINDGRYGDGRYGTVYGGSSRSSFDAWKRQHDANCRALARQRPLDLRWQYQVRSQCAAEERDARRYYGV
ncbi:MAG TPA: hypothetical protein VF092_26765 [Longimicrobium sp.]